MALLSRIAAPLAVIGVGAATFVLVFALLQLGPAEPGLATTDEVAANETPAAVAPVVDSLTARMPPDQVAVGVPTTGWEQLLRDVRPGDRLNVMASLAGASDGRSVTAVVVNGASVLQAASQQAPMLLEVDPDEAVVLAHLVLGGTPLAYVVWPVGGAPPPVTPIFDEEESRARLGLAPRPTGTPVPVAVPVLVAEPTATVVASVTPTSVVEEGKVEPTAAAEPPPLPDRYVVQPGDTLQSIADKFGIDVGALWWANRHLSNPTYVMAGTELVVPRFRGFLYQVRPGDSWFILSRRFGMTPEYLRERNELPQDAPLDAGMFIFVPLSP